MKIKKFLVSGFQGETLNWAIGLLVAFSLVSMIDHWTGTPNDGQSSFVEAFATMQSASAIQIAEAVLLLATQLTMWEVLRRCLHKSGHFFLHLAVIVLMVLSLLVTGVSCYPVSDVTADGNLVPAMSHTEVVLRNILDNSYIAIFLTNLFLGIGLIRKFRGMIRLYGWSVFVCPLLTSLCNFAYLYIYNNVGGVTMTAIQTYGTIFTLIGFVLSLLPFIALRASMTTEITAEESANSDLNAYQ